MRDDPPAERSDPAPDADTERREAVDEAHWVDRWPIAQRMALAVGLPIVLLVGGAVFVAVQVNQLEDLHEQEAQERSELDRAIELEHAFNDVVQASQAYVITGDTRNRSAMDSSISSFNDQLTELEPSVEEQSDLDRLEENATAYIDIARRAQGHVQEDEMERAQEVLTSPSAEEAHANTLTAIENHQTTEQRALEEKQAAITEARSGLESGLVLATLVAVLVASLVGYDITRRTRSMLDGQRRTLQDSLDQLRETHADQQRRHEAQQTRVDSTEASIREARQACIDIDTRLGNAVEMAQEIEHAAEVGNEQLDGTLASLEETDESVSTVAERVLDIGEEMQQLADLAEEVSSIADQIDMLALNASVEASRARAESKGLDEIRDLAGRSQERAQRIQTILESAREESDAAAIALEAGGKAVDETRTRAMETSEAFARVEASLEEGLEEMRELEGVTEEQRATVGDAAEALGDLDADVEKAEAARERAQRLVADLEDVSARLREVA